MPPPAKLPLPPTPMTAPDGTIMVNASKYSRAAVLTVFEMIGGTRAMAEWARENPNEFYTKLFPKTIQKDIEVGARDDVEGLLERLDEGEGFKADEDFIDAEFSVVEDDNDFIAD